MPDLVRYFCFAKHSREYPAKFDKLTSEDAIDECSSVLRTHQVSQPVRRQGRVAGQLNYILPTKNLSFFFKGYHEYSASSHTFGTTFCFGAAWTLLVPKPAPAPKS